MLNNQLFICTHYFIKIFASAFIGPHCYRNIIYFFKDIFNEINGIIKTSLRGRILRVTYKKA